jgi:hypothetical protein
MTIGAVKNMLNPGDSRKWRRLGLTAGVAALLVGGLVSLASPASAAEPAVGLGTASAYSVLAGSAVTNTGASVLSADLGASPANASSVTGFPPGLVLGATHTADAQALQAQADLTTAINDAAGRTPSGASLGSALAGGTLIPGVYNASSAFDLSGALTLNGQGNPASVFIFQIGSALTTASNTSIVMSNDAQPCNVFWEIGSSATLGTGSAFIGTILANTSITLTTGTTVEGRALASTGAVTLDDNVFTAPTCNTTPTTTASSTTASPTTTPTSPATSSAAGVGATGTTAPATGTVGTTSAGLVAAPVAGASTGSSSGPTPSTTLLASTGVTSMSRLLPMAVAALTLGGLILGASLTWTRSRRARPRHIRPTK